MSRIRTVYDLQEVLSEDFSWRKKELHSIKSLVIANENTYKRDLFIRASIPLLYAHWEGFVKHAGQSYLEFVSRQKLNHADLGSSFLALSVGRLVRDATAGNGIEPCLKLVEFFRHHLPTRSSVIWKSIVNTKSNLNSDVLREIVTTLGLDYSQFSTKEKLLDERLLRNRNRIAHGQFGLVTYAEYLELHGEVLQMMQDFSDQIENRAITGGYKAS
jgi:hypothetical protein